MYLVIVCRKDTNQPDHKHVVSADRLPDCVIEHSNLDVYCIVEHIELF